MDASFFVYILASKRNGTLYIGVTNNLARRLAEHKAKLVPGFTRKYAVDQLVYFEAYSSILEVRAREHSLKRWRRAWKIAILPINSIPEIAEVWVSALRRTAKRRCAASGTRNLSAHQQDKEKGRALRRPSRSALAFSRNELGTNPTLPARRPNSV